MNSHTLTQKESKQEQALLLAMKEYRSAQQKLLAAEEEVNALKKQHVTLKDFCEKEREANAQLKEQVNQLLTAVQDKEKQIVDLRKNLDSKQKLPEPQIPLEKAQQQQMQAIKEENSLLEKSLNDSQQHAKQLERAIQFLRERGEESNLETKQLREDFLVNQQKLQELNSQLEKLQQAEVDSKKMYEETLEPLRKNLEEKELTLKMAQQHLAKKMKENAVITERIEAQRSQTLELQKDLSEAHIKVTIAEQKLSLQTQSEKQLQEQLQESLKAAESQIQKWEEKYFQIHDKWEASENKNRLLQRVEDKQKQMQSLLHNLIELMEEVPEVAEQEKTTQTETISHSEEPSLFAQPSQAQASRYKQSLFE